MLTNISGDATGKPKKGDTKGLRSFTLMHRVWGTSRKKIRLWYKVANPILLKSGELEFMVGIQY